MNATKEVKLALNRAIREAGNMRRLSARTGVSYSIINSFNSGRSDLHNIPLGTLERIFPELSIRFVKKTTTQNNGCTMTELKIMIMSCPELPVESKVQILKHLD